MCMLLEGVPLLHDIFHIGLSDKDIVALSDGDMQVILNTPLTTHTRTQYDFTCLWPDILISFLMALRQRIL